MSILKLLIYPDKKLRKIAKPVKKINYVIKQNIKNMFKTMYKKKGIGLAATQININKQIIVIDISKNKNKNIVLINPIIINKYGDYSINEGCLSIPKYYAYIKRAKKIIVKAININNKIYIFKAKNLLAVCIQHEIDHLLGRLFIDYLPLF
ncbi:MAG: peptide deformylase [gamma proteobacterium endosymbiont of Trioza apicalis]